MLLFCCADADVACERLARTEGSRKGAAENEWPLRFANWLPLGSYIVGMEKCEEKSTERCARWKGRVSRWARCGQPQAASYRDVVSADKQGQRIPRLVHPSHFKITPILALVILFRDRIRSRFRPPLLKKAHAGCKKVLNYSTVLCKATPSLCAQRRYVRCVDLPKQDKGRLTEQTPQT